MFRIYLLILNLLRNLKLEIIQQEIGSEVATYPMVEWFNLPSLNIQNSFWP